MTAVLRRHLRHHADGRALWLYGDGPIEEGWSSPPSPATDGVLEQRWDALTGDWVGIAAARNSRPGGDTGCPLCPGGAELPFPFTAAVFENRFPTLRADAPPVLGDARHRASGRCEVVVYSSDHEGSIATLPAAVVARTVAIWRDRSRELWSRPEHAVVLPFENHGAEVGATLPHPHGQIYVFTHVPPLAAQKLATTRAHRNDQGTCLHCETAERESADVRTVVSSDLFAVSVPFAARWPYEVRVHARDHGSRRISDLGLEGASELARILRDVTRRYDGLFGCDLPWMLAVQDAPRDADDWHLLIEFLPPHRSAERLKIRACIETVTGYFINDTLPETTAARLRDVEIEPTRLAEVEVPDVTVASRSLTTDTIAN